MVTDFLVRLTNTNVVCVSSISIYLLQYLQGKAADLKYIELAARTIAEHAQDSKIVVEKSTVPVKAAESIAQILKASVKPGVTYQVLYQFS